MGITSQLKASQFVKRLAVICMMLYCETKADVYIRHGPKHQRIRAGMAVTFRCTAGTDTLLDGVPEIEWDKDDTRINYGKDVRFRKDSVENTLTIRNASTADTGLYTCNAVLGEDRSTASAQLIVEAVPDPPVEVTLTSCDNRVAQLSWQLISENYSPVVQFIIQYNTSFNPSVWHVAKTQLARTRFFQRITLSPYANYSFRVIAQNQIGQSPPSLPTEQTCQMAPDVPHHNPKGVCTLNLRPKTLVIRWELMPPEEQNAPGFHYLVKWRRHDLASAEEFHEKVVQDDLNTLTIENQPIYQEYEIYVLAINEVGEAVSPPRMVIGFSAEDSPIEIPQNFRLHPEKEVTATTAYFQWDAINTGPWRMQGFFKGYKIQFWKTSEGEVSLREHTIIFREPGPCWRSSPVRRRRRRDTNSGDLYNLWPYTNITAQIRTLNAKYEGPPSRPLHFQTKEGVPEQVENFRVAGRGPKYLLLKWDKPSVVNGILLGYHLMYTVLSPYQHTYPTETIDIPRPRSQNEIQLSSLIPDQLYRMTVSAYTSVGHGLNYVIEERTLPGGAPVAPNFTTVNISKRAVNITWFPSIPGNPGTVFTVQYRIKGEPMWQKSDEVRSKSWLVLEGLSPDKVYEVRVVARNGDDPDCPATSSPVRSVQIGRKRELSQPTFEIIYVSEKSYAVGLVHCSPEANAFYVQYKPVGAFYWRYTDDSPVSELVTVNNLDIGQSYQFKVTAKSSLGDADSFVQEVTAGRNPDALVSSSRSTAASAVQSVWLSSVCLASLVALLVSRWASYGFLRSLDDYGSTVGHRRPVSTRSHPLASTSVL